ncbi:hydrogenase-1 operon protein HyaE [Cereibacter ovatus]|uniref:Hydrogenase-1 operon protein HyaE n=1 Tax=Cereibacter ovatus TaxID=439529 RepID=A0A285CNN6_9RHOB|nr:hydrogenase accessory protein [Cereibacter ovatus]SNX69174.1 hydrogenase-1 operon protein HyaE [Cereibacter ovatus]
MTHPLIARLETELGWPRLHTMAEVTEFTARPGAHCLFIPGDPARNLETADAAVVLPELAMTFQRAFDCAIVDDAIEAELRDATRALRTPGFLFYREGRFLGAIEKIRDWADYMTRIPHILGLASV